MFRTCFAHVSHMFRTVSRCLTHVSHLAHIHLCMYRTCFALFRAVSHLFCGSHMVSLRFSYALAQVSHLFHSCFTLSHTVSRQIRIVNLCNKPIALRYPRASSDCERAVREPRGARQPPLEQFCSPRACESVEPRHTQIRVDFWPP